MRKPAVVLLFVVALLAFGSAEAMFAKGLPVGFGYVKDHIPNAIVDARYYGSHNFVGTRVDGYQDNRAILTKPALKALAAVQNDLAVFDLGIKVFDAYRPQRAVDHFVRWANDLDDLKTKAEFYPEVPKNELFKRDYIASRSGHSRGSTVDLTLISITGPDKGKELDMGTAFDFFSPLSWPDRSDMPSQIRANRMLLQVVMARHGFRPYSKEWWHFTLNREPYPDKYFDFPVR